MNGLLSQDVRVFFSLQWAVPLILSLNPKNLKLQPTFRKITERHVLLLIRFYFICCIKTGLFTVWVTLGTQTKYKRFIMN